MSSASRSLWRTWYSSLYKSLQDFPVIKQLRLDDLNALSCVRLCWIGANIQTVSSSIILSVDTPATTLIFKPYSTVVSAFIDRGIVCRIESRQYQYSLWSCVFGVLLLGHTCLFREWMYKNAQQLVSLRLARKFARFTYLLRLQLCFVGFLVVVG